VRITHGVAETQLGQWGVRLGLGLYTCRFMLYSQDGLFVKTPSR